MLTDCDLYVGNLSLEVSEGDLRPLFERFGKVISVKVARDHSLQNSKGYAFVEMDSKGACHTAIKELEGTQIKGRSVILSFVKDRIDYHSNDNTPTKGFW